MSMNTETITIITGKPANGKTTLGRLLHDRLGYTCIEGDSFISPIGKSRLNNGTWNDIDRRIYLSRMASDAVEAKLSRKQVVIADCLTTVWMREYLAEQIFQICSSIAVGFILLERELTPEKISQIAHQRQLEGHALDPNTLIKYRNLFEPWDSLLPMVKMINPGDGNLNLLLQIAQTALKKLWK